MNRIEKMVGDGQAMDERRAMGAEHYILVARRKRPHDMKVPRIGPQRIPVVVRCEQTWERLYHDTLSNVPPQQLHLIPVARGKAPATPLLITNELLELPQRFDLRIAPPPTTRLSL